MSQLKIIAKFRNGKMLRGTTDNFWPSSTSFHVLPVNAPPGTHAAVVSVTDLKAVFVVHDFKGNPNHTKRRHFAAGESTPGQKLQIVFQDGEVVEGSTLDYDPAAPGFFLFPADHSGNNERIYVVNASVKSIRRI